MKIKGLSTTLLLLFVFHLPSLTSHYRQPEESGTCIWRWRDRQPEELWPGRFLVNGSNPPPVFSLSTLLPPRPLGPESEGILGSLHFLTLFIPPQSLLCLYSHHCHPESGSHRSSHLQPSSSFWPIIYITTGLVCVEHSLIPWPPYSKPLMASRAHPQSKPVLLRLCSLVWWLSTYLQWNRYRNWEFGNFHGILTGQFYLK